METNKLIAIKDALDNDDDVKFAIRVMVGYDKLEALQGIEEEIEKRKVKK
jgi:hypothetical protein